MTRPQDNDDIQLSARHRSQAEKDAIGMLMANLCVLPGVGSWMAGYRVIAVIQMALSLVGMLFSILGLIGLLTAIFGEAGISQGFSTPGFLTACAGLGIFLTGWIWALLTGWIYWRRSKTEAAKPDEESEAEV